MIKIIIVDDETHSRETTRMMLDEVDIEHEVLGMAESAIQGADLINAQSPDLLFLDVQMPGMDGIQMLELIPGFKGEIIFVTAHDKYAIEAFKKGALHYLLKPIDPDELKEALKRVVEVIKLKSKKQSGKWMSLSTKDGWAVVQKQDIIRCEAFKNYTTVITSTGSHTVSKTLKDVEAQLQSDKFYRVHASHVIHIESIDKVLKSDGGNVLLKNGDLIPISKNKKKAFIDWFLDKMDGV